MDHPLHEFNVVPGGLNCRDVDSRVSASATVAAPGFGAFTSNYAGGRSTTQVGYTIGGGVEYAITNNVTLKGEYLYVDLGRTSTTAGYLGGASVAGDNFTTRNSTEFSVARAGLNWKFNGF